MTEASLFDLVIHAPESERLAILNRETAGQPELRERVERLVAAHERRMHGSETRSLADSHVNQTNADEPAGSTRRTDDHLAGTLIAGKYKLLERIGEGGMGDVWLAQQTVPVKRQVAVKLIKAGMDSKQVLARFEAERQALAMMDHPNIAKVLDGGLIGESSRHTPCADGADGTRSVPATLGHPYFVMELVKGVPITEYCDHHKLTPKQRLELFVPVCQAIQHAHQKGVIHRDIKPSNVLIAMYDDRPVPKVIDFGVAKATGATLTEHTLNTGFGGLVGTPQYMSPEQATFNNLDIDTRSDVYSLGVLLYELLTGSPPFAKKELEKKGLLEILRVVREEEPPKPSTKLGTADALPSLSASRGTEPKKLTALLRNDLDWIALKALEKDRTRRYETANGFAADVNRYLLGEPIQAHPPSHLYRMRKYISRNKSTIIVGFAVMCILYAAIFISLWNLIGTNNTEKLLAQKTSELESQRNAHQEYKTKYQKALDYTQRTMAEKWSSNIYKHVSKQIAFLFPQPSFPRDAAGRQSQIEFLKTVSRFQSPEGSHFLDDPVKEYKPSYRYAAAVHWGFGVGFQKIEDFDESIRRLELAQKYAIFGFGEIDEITILIGADLAYAYHSAKRDTDCILLIKRIQTAIVSAVRNDPILLSNLYDFHNLVHWQTAWQELLSITTALPNSPEMNRIASLFLKEYHDTFSDLKKESHRDNIPDTLQIFDRLIRRLSHGTRPFDMEQALRRKLAFQISNTTNDPMDWVHRGHTELDLARSILEQGDNRKLEAERMLLNLYSQTLKSLPPSGNKLDPTRDTFIQKSRQQNVAIPCIRQLIRFYQDSNQPHLVAKWSAELHKYIREVLPKPIATK